MSLNRYRMRHLAREGHHGAARARRLLQRPDRLIGRRDTVLRSFDPMLSAELVTAMRDDGISVVNMADGVGAALGAHRVGGLPAHRRRFVSRGVL